jgi:hypothetical protein
MRWIVLVLFLLSGCCGPSEPERAAHAAVFDAVAPEYLEYVEGDEALTVAQRARRAETVSQWRRLVEVGRDD